MIDGSAIRNDTVSWDSFASQAYWAHNYATMQVVDQAIVRAVSRSFSARMGRRGPVAHAVDVGSGSNLYPALLMLPWAERIQLTDYSAQNVEWLRREISNDDQTAAWPWEPFWSEMRAVPGYEQVDAPRKQLREACAVQQVSVFDLPKREWELGTMFFVAESITSDFHEFRSAVACFVHALVPGAPFAVAFMAGSTGYPVGEEQYPALGIDDREAGEALTAAGARELQVTNLKDMPLVRPDYAGMILATGVAGDR